MRKTMNMRSARNKVISGDYVSADIIYDAEAKTVTLSGDISFPLNRDSIAAYKVVTEGYQKARFGLIPFTMLDDMLMDKENRVHHLSIEFADGKRSLLEVAPELCVAIIKNCFTRAPGSCGISLADIKDSCNSSKTGNCSDCPCGRCTLWPKCCLGRIRSRRERYGRK